jgi:hypothetical protein
VCILIRRHGCGGIRHTVTRTPRACAAVEFHPTASSAHHRLLTKGYGTLLTSIPVCQTNANYCQRYRLAARYPQAMDTTTSHIGFRCVLRIT